jgi:hypothetical protein
MSIELGINLVARIAHAPHGLLAEILAVRIATLDHKALDDAMKASAVIKSLLGQFLEIGNGLWGRVRPKLNDHGSFTGRDDRDLRIVRLGGGGVGRVRREGGKLGARDHQRQPDQRRQTAFQTFHSNLHKQTDHRLRTDSDGASNF